jgi:hypothetical protein
LTDDECGHNNWIKNKSAHGIFVASSARSITPCLTGKAQIRAAHTCALRSWGAILEADPTRE